MITFHLVLSWAQCYDCSEHLQSPHLLYRVLEKGPKEKPIVTEPAPELRQVGKLLALETWLPCLKRRKGEENMKQVKRSLLVLRVRQQPMRNPPIEIEAAEKYPYDQEQRNERENKSTQYLTRFDNLPRSSGQGGERSYWFNNQLQLVPYFKKFLRDIFSGVQFMRSISLIYSRESQGFRKPQLNLTPKQKRSLNPFRRVEHVCRSTGPVDRPCPRSTGRSTESQCVPVGRPCRSTVP